MDKQVTILIAEDDMGHASLIKKNLGRAGVTNPILHFKDGQEILDFLFSDTICKSPEDSYLLLLDIRMPKVDGITVLRKLKEDPKYKGLPVIMLTTTDDPKEIAECHNIGCSTYVVKPIDYDLFIKAIVQLGLFFSVIEIPQLNVV
ncbi:MAG: response regulator [Melioribacteraceae bacterium]|nr:response regulator [Melioribacteraceae bacterium]